VIGPMDTIGDADNAVIEAFCGRMQTELLDPRRWTTRGAGQRGLCVTGDLPQPATTPQLARLAHPIEYEKLPPTSPDSHIPRSSGGAQINLIESPIASKVVQQGQPGDHGGVCDGGLRLV
jgi:hypothetical protein